MSHNIQVNNRNKNIRLPQTYRGAHITLNQVSHLKHAPSGHDKSSDISPVKQKEQQISYEEVIRLEKEQQSNNPDKKENFKLRQINVINKNIGVGPSSAISVRENHSNIIVPGLINKANNNKNMSRNGNKNIKFNVEIKDKRQNMRSKLLEENNKKNHTRAKSYFTERKLISNYLPQKLDVKERLSHSVEIKRKTIIRGDKYNNIQITHIISASKPNLDKYNFHIFEKLSTTELNKKPLDLTKIKLYIKKDPNAKSFYNTSCRNVPIKSAEKILRTVHYQHAAGRGMTNLKTGTLNSKFYQSGIENIPLKEIKRAPIVKIINEFRSPSQETNRNFSIGNKYGTNYKFNNKTYAVPSTQRDVKKYQHPKNRENEEKNKLSGKNYNVQKDITSIAPLTTGGNIYTSKTYITSRNNNYNTYKPKEAPKINEKKNNNCEY